MLRTILCVAMLLGLLVPAMAFQAVETEKATKTEAKKAGAKTDAKAATKRETKGRLPANYSKVVDDAQRSKIYGIQSDFNARIDALEAQLKELTDQRDAAIRAVLTDEQQKRLDELVEESKSKRAGKSAAKKSDTDPKTDEAPAKSVKGAK